MDESPFTNSVMKIFQDPIDKIKYHYTTLKNIHLENRSGYLSVSDFDPDDFTETNVSFEEMFGETKDLPSHNVPFKRILDQTFNNTNNKSFSKTNKPELIISNQIFDNMNDNELDNKFEKLDMMTVQNDLTLVSKCDLDFLAQNVQDLKELSVEMGNMLNSQSEVIEHIEKNVDITTDNLIKSEKELDKALEMKYKIGGIIDTTIVTGSSITGAVTGSIFGPLGSAIGAGIGLGSGVLIILLKDL